MDALTTADAECICHEYNVPANVVKGAHNHGDREVFTMVLTHRYMACVMKELGLQQEIYELYTLAKGAAIIHTKESRKVISINTVLGAFGWKPDSYKNKSAWYKWANDMVASKWWKCGEGFPRGK